MKKLFVSLFLIIFLLNSCQENEPLRIPSEDLIIFDKLKQLFHEAEIVWSGYDYIRTKPAYIILRDDDGSNPRGYLLNPVGSVEGSIKLNVDQSFGLNLYRNDKFIKDANDVLGEDGLFNFGDLFSINGTPFFLIRSKSKEQYTFYDDFKNVNDNWVPLIMVHEMFHTYQIAKWSYPQEGTQDFLNYPLTIDVMTYELALFDLMKSAHLVNGQVQAREKLAQYIVLFEEMIAHDPSSLLIVKNMGTFQQFLEGSARYVEHFAAHNSIYPSINEDPTHGWGAYLDGLNSGDLVRHIFAVRAWYHVGSGVIHLLNEVGEPVHDRMMNGETPYDISVDLLELTDLEKDTIREQLVNGLGWNAYVLKATYLHSLL